MKYKILLFVFFIFILHCLYYYPFFADDSLISLRYAKRFIEGKGLTWNDGEFIEGYSNFLWIIFVSFLGKIGIDLIAASRILGIILSFFTLYIIYSHFRNFRRENVLFGLLFLVLTASFPVWTIGGLEQPLVIFFTTLIVTSVFSITDHPENSSNWIILSVSCGLLSITRPDGILFTVLTVLFLIYNFRKNINKILAFRSWYIILIPALFYVGLLVFRLYYYGEYVPNTALVKAKFSVHHLIGGIKYFIKFFIGTFPFNCFSVYFLIGLSFQKNKKALFLLLLASVWSFYIVFVGGDIFPAFRQLEIVILIFSIALIYGLEQNMLQINGFMKKNRNIIFVAVLFMAYFIFQVKYKYNDYAKTERWEFKGMKIGKIFKNSFPENTLIGVTAAGSIPYASDLPTVDMLGLNDYYLPRNPPDDFGNGILAHELGDSNYILNIRKPDILIFNTGDPEPDFPFAKELLTNIQFKQQYIKTFIFSSDISESPITIFLNKYGKNAGIKYKNDKIEVPYYLLSASNGLSVKNNQLELVLTQSEKIKINNVNHKKWKLVQDKNFTGTVKSNFENIEIEIIPLKNKKINGITLLEDR